MELLAEQEKRGWKTHKVGGDTVRGSSSPRTWTLSGKQEVNSGPSIKGTGHSLQTLEAEPRPQGITKCHTVSPGHRANPWLAKPPLSRDVAASPSKCRQKEGKVSEPKRISHHTSMAELPKLCSLEPSPGVSGKVRGKGDRRPYSNQKLSTWFDLYAWHLPEILLGGQV